MRLKIIVGSVILVVILLSTYYFLVKSEGFYKAEVTVEECGDNYQKASELLMERYLSHYCSPVVGLRNYLINYKVIKIDADVNTNGSDCYGFTTTYNVRMFTKNDWLGERKSCIWVFS